MFKISRCLHHAFALIVQHMDQYNYFLIKPKILYIQERNDKICF